MLKFNLHHILNTETKDKIKVSYSINESREGVAYVAIYAKNYGVQFVGLIAGATNDSDCMTDYFQTDCVMLTKGHEHFEAALATAKAIQDKRKVEKSGKGINLEKTGENEWKTTVRGIEYTVTYRFKPGYKSWAVQTKNPQAHFGGTFKWCSTPTEIECVFRNLRGVAILLAPPENCIPFRKA